MRFFNVSGPCDPRFHYMLPALERLPEAPELVDRGAYFVVLAPRRTAPRADAEDAPQAERARFEDATTPAGRPVIVLYV